MYTRDNEIYPVTRLVAAIVVPFLWLAFLILYFYPDMTGERFAWAIRPHMMALYMGAGYLGGSWLFMNALFGKRWHRIQSGFLPVTAFTWFIMLSTFLHWDRFLHGNLGFMLWLALYVITPFLVPAIWFYNRKTDPGQSEADDIRVPATMLWILRLIAAGSLLFVIAGFINPNFVIDVWPWMLTPLTARLMCGWVALLGVGAFIVSTETRWSGWKVPLESIAIWHMLVLVGAAINPADFKTGLVNWYTIAIEIMLIGIFIFYTMMERRRHTAR
ncbi:MAG TPA: hypothetical protein VFZ43_00105 [Anaerolineales bacterium]